MVLEFVFQHIFMCGILLYGAISIFLQWIMSLSLQGYVKASANMNTTKKKMMIHLKQQFETIYGMEYNVRNVDAYVDKYLLKLRFMGLSYSFWEKAPALSAGIATLIAGGMAFYTYSVKSGAAEMTEIVFAYGIVLSCLFVFAHIFGVKSKKQQMHIQLVDYLENYLINRVAKGQTATRDSKVLEEIAEDAFIEGVAKNDELKRVVLEKEKEIAASKEEPEAPEKMKQTDVELLEEFVQSFLA